VSITSSAVNAAPGAAEAGKPLILTWAAPASTADKTTVLANAAVTSTRAIDKTTGFFFTVVTPGDHQSGQANGFRSLKTR